MKQLGFLLPITLAWLLAAYAAVQHRLLTPLVAELEQNVGPGGFAAGCDEFSVIYE
jgi:hypothetical protein